MRQDDDEAEVPELRIPVTTITDGNGRTIRTAEAELNGGRITASMPEGNSDKDQLQIVFDINADGKPELTVTTQENGFGFATGPEPDGTAANQGIYRDQSSQIAKLGRALLAKGSLSQDEFATFAVDTFDLTESGRNADIMESMSQAVQRR